MQPKASPYKDLRQKIEAVVEEILDGYKPTKLYDDKVIRGSVFGFNVFFRHEINVLDSPLLQRLRRIHQTALAFLTYPSSTHTRFEHSLGVTAIANKMINAINAKYPSTQPLIGDVETAEVRLACLMHDCGHGPFSHASEAVYGHEPYEIPLVKMAEKDLFGRANPHEIISYCIVTSEAFEKLWDEIKDLYDLRRDKVLCNFENIDLKRVGAMILGKKAQDYPLYLSQIVNGPFDADKFDYIIRDGYFSGLITAIDIERLFISLDSAPFREHGYKKYREDVLCMDIGGATVLEQVLFNKMILFSSFYHHHKIRAAFRMLVYLLELLHKEEVPLKNISLDEAPNFLLLDDDDVLGCKMQEYPPEIRRLVTSIRNRSLPKRALVITKDALLDDESKAEYFRLLSDPKMRVSLEKKIAKKAGGIQPIFIDFPEEAQFVVSGLHSLVRLAPKRYVTLDKLYPAAGWVSGYAEYRYRSYVFSPKESQKAVNNAALKVFEEATIALDRGLCSELAKLLPDE